MLRGPSPAAGAVSAALPALSRAGPARGDPRPDDRGHQVGGDVEGGAHSRVPAEGDRQGAEPPGAHPQLLRQQLPRPREQPGGRRGVKSCP